MSTAVEPDVATLMRQIIRLTQAVRLAEEISHTTEKYHRRNGLIAVADTTAEYRRILLEMANLEPVK